MIILKAVKVYGEIQPQVKLRGVQVAVKGTQQAGNTTTRPHGIGTVAKSWELYKTC